MTEARSLEAVNPATGRIISTYPLMNQAEIVLAIEQAHSGFQQWSQSDFSVRS
jgi:succinate-semialdehyde dehydrogenase/glutarate-semialdehyde dehydrogenase